MKVARRHLADAVKCCAALIVVGSQARASWTDCWKGMISKFFLTRHAVSNIKHFHYWLLSVTRIKLVSTRYNSISAKIGKPGETQEPRKVTVWWVPGYTVSEKLRRSGSESKYKYKDVSDLCTLLALFPG